jgi:hypothetical protein
MSSQPPGWYPDAQGQQRYWDGNQWTEHVAPAAGGPQAAAAGTGASRPSPALFAAIAAAVVAGIGSVGAWATAFGDSLAGLDTDDGKVVLGIAVASLVLLLIGFAVPHRWPYVVPLLAGGFAAVVTIIDLGDLQDTGVDAGWGLYASIAGSVALTILALVLLIKPRR